MAGFSIDWNWERWVGLLAVLELLVGVDEGLQLLLVGCHLLESRRCGEYGLCCFLPVKRLDSDRRRAEGSCLDERHKLLGRCVYLVDLALCSYSKVRVSTAYLLLKNLDINLLSRN